MSNTFISASTLAGLHNAIRQWSGNACEVILYGYVEPRRYALYPPAASSNLIALDVEKAMRAVVPKIALQMHSDVITNAVNLQWVLSYIAITIALIMQFQCFVQPRSFGIVGENSNSRQRL